MRVTMQEREKHHYITVHAVAFFHFYER